VERDDLDAQQDGNQASHSYQAVRRDVEIEEQEIGQIPRERDKENVDRKNDEEVSINGSRHDRLQGLRPYGLKISHLRAFVKAG